MVSLSGQQAPANITSGMRPVNLSTDLAPLADLIELVFADSLDSNGRAALREMRYLSKMGPGMRLLSRMNEMALGIRMGYVWVEEGRLVGNVSVYAANWPADLGKAWIIANVGVHPHYQGRGIARQLMLASMEMIRQAGAAAILQVDVDNHIARHLYRSLGFAEERAWTTWRRASYSRLPDIPPHDGFVAHRQRSDWTDEYILAAQQRPPERGGIGWLRPLHPSQFRKSLWGHLTDWINLRSTERLVLRAGEPRRVVAALWVETAFAARTHLTLFTASPEHAHYAHYNEVLLNTAIRRYGRNPLGIEHPLDDDATSTLLERYRFVRQRSVMHMRWNTH